MPRIFCVIGHNDSIKMVSHRLRERFVLAESLSTSAGRPVSRRRFEIPFSQALHEFLENWCKIGQSAVDQVK